MCRASFGERHFCSRSHEKAQDAPCCGHARTSIEHLCKGKLIKVQQSSLRVYYVIGDKLLLCVRYCSYVTRGQQSSNGVHYAIGDIVSLW